MKQVLLNLHSGSISVEEVPIPAIKKGVIIKTQYSLISAGTESSLIHLAEESLIGKAKSRPDLFIKVVNKVKTDGILSAYEQAMSRLDKPEPLGYCCSGIVVESNVDEFSVGDRVGCGGTGYANHAEYNYVPKNLCVKLPSSVSLRDGSFMTVGAIALQGIRNAKISVGEVVVVIGLGLVGILTIQIAKAAGCRVVGIDIDQQKLHLATELGADIVSTNENGCGAVYKLSEFGADAVIITAATKSNAPIEQAGELVRDKGRIVVVGDISLDIPRALYYEKEAEVVVSRSYGPGRYDRTYEEKGIDYPIAIRWTEKRNMQAFVDLLKQKKVSLDKIITHEYSIENASEAYELIKTGRERYIGVILKYDSEFPIRAGKNIIHFPQVTKTQKKKTDVSIGFIGAGIHATSTLLPNLKKLPVKLKGVATSTGLTAHSVAKKFDFEYCTTDYHELLNDPEINAVIIATRNDTHAQITIDALNAGKNVFVEKPLATNIEELRAIKDAWIKSNQKVMVGFNRRYSPYSSKIKEFFYNTSTPLVMNYRVNAGSIGKEHWIYDDEQGGNMLISECCHFVDLLQYITNSHPIEVYAHSIISEGTDCDLNNIQIMLLFKNGSTGTITYTINGNSAYSKELLEIFGSHSVAMLRDFREVQFVRNGKKSHHNSRFKQEKGIFEEVNAFIQGNIPDFRESLISTLAIFKIQESIVKKTPVVIEIHDFN